MKYSEFVKKAKSLNLVLGDVYYGKSRVDKPNKKIVNLSVGVDGSWIFSNKTTQSATYRSGLGDAKIQSFPSGEVTRVETVSFQDIAPIKAMSNKEFFNAVMALDKYVKTPALT